MTYPEPDTAAAAEAREDRWLKLGIGIFGIVLFLTIVASIHLSTLEVSFGSFVYGSKSVWTGHPAYFRVAALDPRGTRFLPRVGVKATLLYGNAGKTDLEPVISEDFVELVVPVPATAGDGNVDFLVVTDWGEDKFQVPIRGVKVPGPVIGRIVHFTDSLERKAIYAEPGDTASESVCGRAVATCKFWVNLYPQQHDIVAGFDNVVDGRLFSFTDDGSTFPVANRKLKIVPYSRAPQSRLTAEATTDTHGFFSFEYKAPLIKNEALEFQLDGVDEKIRWPHATIKVKPSQMVLETIPATVAKPGSTITVNIRTLPFNDPIILDIWAGDVRIQSESVYPQQRIVHTKIKLPEDHSGPIRIDAYRDFAAPGRGHLSRLIWVIPTPDQIPYDAIRGQLQQIGGTDPILEHPVASEAWLRAALSRYAPTEATPLIHSTLESRQQAVEERVGALRGHVHTLYGLTLLIGMLFGGTWAIRYNRRRKHDLDQVLTDAVMAGEEIAPARVTQHNAFDMVMVASALLIATYSIWVLLTRIRWD